MRYDISRCTSHLIEVQFLLSRLRYRYGSTPVLDAIASSIYFVYGESELRKVTRAIKARKVKKKRIQGRIFGMQMNYPGKLLFLTVTFDDHCLESSSQSSRHQFVYRWLSEHCLEYVANIDFGSKNGREHYHAVVVPKENKIDFHTWKYGAVNCKHFGNSTTDRRKVAKYITKLVNHSQKYTSGGVIYSRLPKTLQGQITDGLRNSSVQRLHLSYADTIAHEIPLDRLDELPF